MWNLWTLAILHLADRIVNAVNLTDTPYAHASICVLVLHQIVGLNVLLVLIADLTKHVLIKNVKILVLECVVLMHNVKW